MSPKTKIVIVLLFLLACICITLVAGVGFYFLSNQSQPGTAPPPKNTGAPATPTVFVGVLVRFEPDIPADVPVDPQQLAGTASILQERTNSLGAGPGTTFNVTGPREITGWFPFAKADALAQSVQAIKAVGLLEFVDLGTTLLPEGSMIQTDYLSTSTPTETGEIWHTIMTNAGIKTASVTKDQVGQPVIAFELSEDGRQIFADFTSNHIGSYLAVVMDKKILSTPVIQSAITAGKGQISGSFTLDDATAMAAQMAFEPLPFPLTVIEIKQTPP